MNLFRPPVRSTARSLANDRAYQRYKNQRGDTCDFCHVAESASQVIAEHVNFSVLTNAFPYSIWDSASVKEHMLLVPKRHVESVSQFTHDEQSEFMELLASYEQQGYNFYGRGMRSQFKSIPHQHTHLMKLGEQITPTYGGFDLSRINLFK